VSLTYSLPLILSSDKLPGQVVGKLVGSGTDWNIIDTWGDTNPFNHQTEIICGVGKGLDQPGPRSDIIRIKEDLTTEKLDLTGLGQVYAPIWFMSCIQGTGLNNIVVAGAYGEFIHFNGSKWKSLRDQTSLENGTYYSVAVKANIVAAVGQNQNQGVILIGYHQ
jgi:hypothetical protein